MIFNIPKISGKHRRITTIRISIFHCSDHSHIICIQFKIKNIKVISNSMWF